MGDMADALIDEGMEIEAARGSGSTLDPEQEAEQSEPERTDTP